MMSEKRSSLELTIKRQHPGLNAWMRKPWRSQRRESKVWSALVLEALNGERPRFEGMVRIIHVRGFCGSPLDPDNLIIKCGVDALVSRTMHEKGGCLYTSKD